MATLDIINIKKNFGNTAVLHNLSISLADGEFLVLVGPSGCGKSTLMNIIAGLDEPTEGAIHLDGRDITNVAPASRDISMVFQSYALYPNMTVAQNIEFPLQMRKVPPQARAARVREVAQQLQIENLLHRKPRQLSGGQRQRVAIGRALAREPKLYLFDEPLSNLDAQLRGDMRTEIKKLHQRLKATVVYVTHDQIEAMTLAYRVAVMHGGILQQLGTPREVYNRPANIFVASFIGSPRMNLLRARLIKKALSWALVFQAGEHPEVTLDLPAQVVSPALMTFANQEVIAGIRPEAISNTATNTSQHSLRTQVIVTEPTGADTLAIINLGGHELTARLEPESTALPGHTAQFHVDLSKLVCFDPATQKLIS